MVWEKSRTKLSISSRPWSQVMQLNGKLTLTSSIDTAPSYIFFARPTSDDVLLHPFFWNSTMRLNFLCEASDRFEIMERDPPDLVLVDLESEVATVLGNDWLKRLDPRLVENLGKYRKYDGASVRDLLRVIRNKKHHYLDLPDPVRKSLGSPPEDFLTYFTQRFPLLFLHVWSVIAKNVSHESLFEANYFRPPD